MNKIFIMLFSIAISTLFVSCNKDVDSIFSSSQIGKNYEVVNPYNFVGENHNEFLNYVASHYNVNNLTTEKLYQAYCQFGTGFEPISFDQYIDRRNFLFNEIIKYSNHESSFFTDGSIADARFAYYVNKMNEVMVEFALSGNLPSPGEFKDRIHEIEVEILSNHDIQVVTDMNAKVGTFESLLCMLAIANYSYDYWYEAYHNVNNPWYDVVNKAQKEEKKKKGFWGSLWSGVTTAAKAVATPFVDAYGFIEGAATSDGSINEGIRNAGSRSGDLWPDGGDENGFYYN